MMNYEFVLFDLDNTLLDFDQAQINAFWAIVEAYDIPKTNTLYEDYQVINKKVWQELEKGTITPNQVKELRFKRFLEFLNVDTSIANDMSHQYLIELSKHAIWIDDARAILEDYYRERSLSLITNGLSLVQNGRLEKADMFRYFQHILISEEIKVAKPQYAFFNTIHQRLGQPPKESVLVVGDSLSSDIAGGLEFGYKTCWFNPDQVDASIQPDYNIQNLETLRSIL